MNLKILEHIVVLFWHGAIRK